jgi:hypothetical protein
MTNPTISRKDPYKVWDFRVLIGMTCEAAVVVVMDASLNFPNRE